MSAELIWQIGCNQETNHGYIKEYLPGNNYEVSGYWKIFRLNGGNPPTIAFERLDAIAPLPFEKAYGCRGLESPNINLYFSRVRKAWPKQLAKFTKELNELA